MPAFSRTLESSFDHSGRRRPLEAESCFGRWFFYVFGLLRRRRRAACVLIRAWLQTTDQRRQRHCLSSLFRFRRRHDHRRCVGELYASVVPTLVVCCRTRWIGTTGAAAEEKSGALECFSSASLSGGVGPNEETVWDHMYVNINNLRLS